MGKNYYYLIAGLPDVSMEDTKPACSLSSFREEYYAQLGSDDQRLVDLLYLETDNANLLRLMAGGIMAEDGDGLYTEEELRTLIADARNDEKYRGRCPRYMYDFVQAEQRDADGTPAAAFASDRLAARYYAYAMNADNAFVADWFRFNLRMNNVLTAITARKYQLDRAAAVIGDDEVCEALRTSAARDFGLAGTLDEMDEMLRIAETENLVEREHKIDALRWNWLEEHASFKYFTVERLIAFLVKGQIAQRWALLDAEEGGRMLRAMVEEMKNNK